MPLHRGKSSNDWYLPSPFGANKRGYWLPVILALLQCFTISAVTIGMTYAGYLVGAHYHNYLSRFTHIW